jgi:diguanylate cyclase (GGDEF)-like protein
MNPSLTRTNVWKVAVRNYWWGSSLIGVYFAGSFWLWGASRAAMLSSGLFLLITLVGLAVQYHINWKERLPRVVLIVGHLLIGQGILVWQKAHLPLTDYTASGNPAIRDLLIYLTSVIAVGAMGMFGGVWGALVGLSMHYLFIFNVHEEYSLKWIFPGIMAIAGCIVSTAFWRLDQAYEQLEDLANQDHLTGLLNRHRLVIEYERLQTLAREMGQPLLLVAWDLDGLKQINDQQGHAAGDAHIRNFASALQASVRKSSDSRYGDAAFRVGGDEFISMHLQAHDGEKLLERIHQSCPFVSAGWVQCHALTLDQALTRADKALYASKERRRQDLSRAANSAGSGC